MIRTLHIQHFLSFEDLLIPKLKRVNLIAGKNNVGKTALLEAVRIYTAQGEESVVNTVLKNRGVFMEGWERNYDYLFNRSSLAKHPDLPLFLSLAINDLSIERHNDKKSNQIQYTSEFNTLRTPLNAQKSYVNPREETVYIPFQSEFQKLTTFWENIVLTPKEDAVIEILQNSIEPQLIRFDVGQNGVKIRLSGVETPLPLSTLGDGMQRLLLIALGLANAQGSYLLIDEIESGLHYTVLEKLWEMIFKYAVKWNLQVFATTHSQDAIKAFYYVASQEVYTDDAEFIRLQHSRKGSVEAVVYDGKALENILDLDLEIR